MDDTDNKRLLPAYVGQSSDIFWLGVKTSFLTIITLGIYRFWAKTRIRNYVWSSVRVGGDPAEYTGNGLEKFLGFLIAIVVLAVYLGIVQLLLSFAGFSFLSVFDQGMSDEEQFIRLTIMSYIVLIALLPLIFFAAYRSRRYMMSRTRWRGLRFGMTPGALGYMWRGLVYMLISLVSLGLLTPFSTFRLAKYLNDRTWFGDAQFEQGGKWTGLYAAMKHLFIAIGIFVAGIFSIAFIQEGLGVFLFIIGYVWIIVGSIYFRVHTHRYLMAHLTLDQKITFTAEPTTGTVIKHYFLGTLIVSGIMFAAFVPLLILIAIMGAATGSAGLGQAGAVIIGFTAVLGYLFAIAVSMAGSLAFIVQPIISHFVTTTTINNAEHLDEIQQRAGDSIADADGFAEALDFGSAI